MTWFLRVPQVKDIIKDSNYLGFNYQNISTFYINKDRFKKNDSFINLIDHLSIDLGEMRRRFLRNKRQDEINGPYKHFQNYFDKPVFKINENEYCIIDLKFLVEGVCSGFIWQLNSISDNEVRQIKEQYGYLMEEYFSFLVSKIFNNILLTNNEAGKPDAILELDDQIIIFEFTTEYYRFASLYNSGTDEFLKDLYKIFFNEGRNDKRGRNKKDKGKFFKLATYIDLLKSKDKKIVPIIVTENYVGDYDLINEFNKFFEENISEKNLDCLKKYKPLIISLDDLETFWAFSDLTTVDQILLQFIESWENLKRDKSRYHYNFSYFLCHQTEGRIKNNEFMQFFDFHEFLK